MDTYVLNAAEPLSERECRELLATASVGRLGITIAALPEVIPVLYTLRDGQLVVRTPAGTELDGALDGTVVAFEVDEVDRSDGSGWFVQVLGRAAHVRPHAGVEVPVVRGEPTRFVRLTIERLAGRRLRPAS